MNQVQKSQFSPGSFIGKALDRKNISLSYYSAYPEFLKMESPFKAYNPAKHGSKQSQSIKESKNEAVKRFHQELIALKNLREHEKDRHNR
eukprot:CAMPEP_0170555742 /NCGR_PEP_ID=MMETSP0211-20121228/13578_1 /TAXON_ID=311385 /ORGANISM="Pseudokeronopsis sp., Strain OXSARD2" /LENGTH=89 /DNA_ID=CAMNT_0010865725 /DNA_START=1382 /DNA_END=1651 /DNA_ORIENTATION=-